MLTCERVDWAAEGCEAVDSDNLADSEVALVGVVDCEIAVCESVINGAVL